MADCAGCRLQAVVMGVYNKNNRWNTTTGLSVRTRKSSFGGVDVAFGPPMRIYGIKLALILLLCTVVVNSFPPPRTDTLSGTCEFPDVRAFRMCTGEY